MILIIIIIWRLCISSVFGKEGLLFSRVLVRLFFQGGTHVLVIFLLLRNRDVRFFAACYRLFRCCFCFLTFSIGFINNVFLTILWKNFYMQWGRGWNSLGGRVEWTVMILREEVIVWVDKCWWESQILTLPACPHEPIWDPCSHLGLI